MKNFKISMVLCAGVCSLSLLACSDDSSSSPAAADEISSSSEAVESSSSQKSGSSEDLSSANESKSSDSFNVRVKSSASKNPSKDPQSSSSSKAPESSAQKENPKSSAQKDEPKSSAQKEVSSSSGKTEEPVSSTDAGKDWRDICLDIINEYRATEDLGPLARATDEKQTCTDKQAAADLAGNAAHGHFGDCGEGAQNTGPNVRMSATKSYSDYAEMYLKMMWEDEKALVTSGKADPDSDADYPKIGHYLNMKGKYRTVSCGFAESSDGKTGWLNIDFFR